MSTNGNGRDRRIDTDGEWAREVERRLDALARQPTSRVGGWVLSERDGEIVATKPGRAAVNITRTLVAVDQPGGTERVMRVVTLVGPPTGGTWGLLFRGAPTINTLSINATSTAVLNAILALDPRYTALDFNVTGANGGPWTITTPAGSLDADSTLLTAAAGVTPVVDIQYL